MEDRSGSEARSEAGIELKLEVLFEEIAASQTAVELPAALAKAFGGELRFSRPRLVANFVSSVDGVVTLPEAGESGKVISGDSAADRLVMALLRACADVVLIGAGTFRKDPGALWQAQAIFPDAAAPLAELRQRLELRPQPPLALVSASGEIELGGPALDDAIIFTTQAGAERLRGRAPAGTQVRALDPGPIHLAHVLESLRADFPLILTEGGPSLVGQLASESLLDELFVTSAPSLFGRSPGDGRKSLIDGVHLAGGERMRLMSARRHGSHLFLRYSLKS